MTQRDDGRTVGGTGEADRLGRAARSQADTARQEAGGVVEEARGAARDLAAEARRTGQALKSEAAGLVGTVQQRLASQAEAQKDGLAERIAAVAQQVRGAADGMRGREAWLSDLIDRGARELDGFADELRRRDVRGLVGGVETLAHRHPALFMGTAVMLGFALTRMVRGAASDVDRGPDRGYAGGYGSPGYAGATTAGAYIDPDASRPDLGAPDTFGAGARPTGAGGLPTTAPDAARGSDI